MDPLKIKAGRGLSRRGICRRKSCRRSNARSGAYSLGVVLSLFRGVGFLLLANLGTTK
jgi:hypothetical protein